MPAASLGPDSGRTRNCTYVRADLFFNLAIFLWGDRVLADSCLRCGGHRQECLCYLEAHQDAAVEVAACFALYSPGM